MDQKAFLYAKMAYRLDPESLDALEIYLYMALRLDELELVKSHQSELSEERKNALYIKIIACKKSDEKEKLPSLLKQYLAIS